MQTHTHYNFNKREKINVGEPVYQVVLSSEDQVKLERHYRSDDDPKWSVDGPHWGDCESVDRR